MADSGTVAARLFVEVGARGLSETSAGLATMGQNVTGAQNSIGGLVRAVGGIYAVKQGFDATIGSAIAWESAFAGVEKTVDASDAELAHLEGTLRGMSRTMPIAAEDLAGIAEAAGALGVQTASIDEFTETVAQIGETTNVSVDQAATSLGQLSNILHLTEQDYDNFGAALVDLGNKGASTEQDILGIATRAGAGAALIDIAADATLGWSAAVANLGIEAEAGGSALQRFFLGMTEHVAAAGDELDAIAQTAGMTASEFTRAFNEDSSAALQSFIGGMEGLAQAEQLALLELLGFSDVRISRTLLGLAGNTENLNSALDTSATAWQDNTALAVEYGKRAETTEAKLEMLGNRISDVGRTFGENFLPAMNVGVDALSGLAEHGDALIPIIGTASVVIATKMVPSLTAMGTAGWAAIGPLGAVVIGLQAVASIGEEVHQSLAPTEHSFNQLASTGHRSRLQIEADVNKMAEDLGVSAETVRLRVLRAAETMDGDFGKAMDSVATGAGGLPVIMDDVSRQAIAAWKQADLGGVISEDVEKIDDLFARGGLDIAQPISEEMAKAREAAVDGMAAILDNLNDGLRDGKEGYKQSWQDFLDGQKDPFTTAQRTAFIAGTFAGEEYDAGLHSKDPEHVANTVEYVNQQLAEFNVLVPGALQTGKDVPAALQEGMDEIMPELQQYIMDKTGETLANLDLDEAQKLGIDGIYLYFLGMQQEEENNKFVAGAIATRAVNALTIDASSGGASIIKSWIDGMNREWNVNGKGQIWTIADGAKRRLGGSLPTEGPLAGGVGSGGESIIESWLAGMSSAFNLAAVEDMTGAVKDALTGTGPAFAAGLPTASATDMGSGDTIINVNLTFNGDAPSDKEGIADAVWRAAYVAVGDRALIGN